MSDLVYLMRRHVSSYKSLTRHRQDCLEMCDRIETVETENKQLRKLISDCAELLEKDVIKDQPALANLLRKYLTGERPLPDLPDQSR